MTVTDVLALAEDRMLIDGRLVSAAGNRTFTNVNPATEEMIGVASDGERDDFEAAIAAARRAYDTTSWSRDHEFRSHCLHQLYAALDRIREEIRQLVVLECGTPVWLTRDTLLDVPMERLLDNAKLAASYPYDTAMPDLDFRGIVSQRLMQREGIGVAAVITPWNGPWSMNIYKASTALAAGCTVVLKAAPDTPWAATVLGRLAAEETDLPPGVFNVVTSSDDLMGEVLTTDPRVDLITFTGSSANGRRIAAAAAGTLKRIVLELGGKSAHIVLDDADIATEAAAAGRTICVNAGQGCVARSRLLLPRAGYEEGVQAAREAMDAVTYGDPSDPANFMGPLISVRHRDRVMRYIEGGWAEGARLVRGGRRPDHLDRGYYVEPTLFADVDPNATIAQEEIFGPVLSVIPYESEDDAVAIANGTIYGLSGAVTSASDDRAMAVARRLRAGTCNVNGGQWMHMDIPFGGYKQSGMGREFGVTGFEEFLETKVLGVPSGAESQTSAW
jgi:aldehyde dehydrogenase (NAD+)